MPLTIGVLNRKAGTGKTTSAIFMALGFAELGPVLLVDADPAASALEWSDLAAEDGGGFPFRVVALPSKQLHQRLPDIVKPGEVVVIDTPQTEDHAAIAGSVMRYADELVITCAPTGIEINRTTPIMEQIEAADVARRAPARVSVLLNRAIPNTHSLANTRAVLSGLGYAVLDTTIYRAEVYAQSFGAVPPAASLDPWRAVAAELAKRAR
jgi:chromosome partitioning protein